MITTRLATLADLDAVAALFDAYRQFYDQPADRALARRFIEARLRRDESVVIVASNADGVIVGICQLYPTFCSVDAQPIYVLYDLYVDASARRSGAGSALLRAAEQIARDRGMSRLDLSTARTNTTAQSVYEALGWVRNDAFFVYAKRVDPRPAARGDTQGVRT